MLMVGAERRRIEAHPRTGAIQIVEVRERIEESVLTSRTSPARISAGRSGAQPLASAAFPRLCRRTTYWLSECRRIGSATCRPPPKDAFLALADHLPAEAAEALLEFVGTGKLRKPAPVIAPTADPFAHPDALRRFRVVENQEALALALDAPWERWAVFLHPTQQGIVDRAYNGPARSSGSAGTGKTVVCPASGGQAGPGGRGWARAADQLLAAAGERLGAQAGRADGQRHLRRPPCDGGALPRRGRRAVPTCLRPPRRRGIGRAGRGCGRQSGRLGRGQGLPRHVSSCRNGGTWWMPGRSGTWRPMRRCPGSAARTG